MESPINIDPFVIERTYQAPVRKVWEAITNKEKMKEWHFDLPEFKPEPGFEFSFYGGTPQKSYLHLCRVTHVSPEKLIAHTWRYDGYPGNSEVTWELFDKGDQTLLKLSHSGLLSFPADEPDFKADNFVQGWTHITGISLKEYLEKA